MPTSDALNSTASKGKAWWIYLVYVLFLPFTLTWFIAKSNWSTKTKVILIVLLWGLFVAASQSGKSKAENQIAVNKAAVATPTTAQPTVSALTQGTLSTEERLWKAIDDTFRSRNGYNVTFDSKTGTARLTYTKNMFLDEESTVRTAYTYFVKYGENAFKLEGVDRLTMQVKTEFTDSYGKKNNEIAVRVTMPKSEFMKYDWKAFEFKNAYPAMERSAEENYIHPAIFKNVDTEKLHLNFLL